MKRIYLDHAAATPVAPQVVDTMKSFWIERFGNPSSIHREGVVVKDAIMEARKSIAGQIDVHADEIVFTGSATESCNLALRGTVSAWKMSHPHRIPHIVVCAIEHDSVLATARALQGEGAILSFVAVNEKGVIDINELVDVLNLDTVIISVGYANNEIGVIQPLREISHAVRKWKKQVREVARDVRIKGDDIYPLFHTDACQATNYLDLNVPHLGVDLLTMNAAKIYGPKGIALLYAHRNIPISSMIVGGGQERGLRAGTENAPLIIGFAEALRIAAEMRESESLRLVAIRDYAISELKKDSHITINGSLSSRLPNNIHISIRGVDHEFFCLALDARGFAVSTKSACNEEDAEHSHVLASLCSAGHDGGVSGLRITLGRETTREGIDSLLNTIADIRNTLIVTPV